MAPVSVMSPRPSHRRRPPHNPQFCPPYSNFTPLILTLLLFSLLLTHPVSAAAAFDSHAASLHALASDCVPVSTSGKLSADHSAHAVPGRYPPAVRPGTPSAYVDADGDGFYTVRIDGGGSHTHFLDPARYIAGRLIRTVWKDVATNTVISRSLSFTKAFPVGVTKLSLTVVDNACNAHTAQTTVTVGPRYQRGAYCYVYVDRTSYVSTPLSVDNPRPTFATVIPGTWWNVNSAPPFRARAYVARCFFRLRAPRSRKVTLGLTAKNADNKGTGSVKLMDGSSGKTLVSASPTRDGAAQFTLSTGQNEFELQFKYTETVVFPRFIFRLDGRQPGRQFLTHNRAPVVPILTATLPASAGLAGGRVRLVGYGLYPPIAVRVGSVTVAPQQSDGLSTELYVRVPALSAQQQNGGGNGKNEVPIQVISATGVQSNSLTLRYIASKCDAPAFDPGHLTMPSGGGGGGEKGQQLVKVLKQPTCATLGPDRRLYVGTLSGTVAVLGYDALTNVATSYCTSKPLKDPVLKTADGKDRAERAILGIAFDGTSKDPRKRGPYISTSTLNYWNDERVSLGQAEAWYNGGVDRMYVSTSPGLSRFSLKNYDVSNNNGDERICVSYDRRIVSGLPVANGGSHSINALHFSPTGDLLIAVGGGTNMGLPGHYLGNLWESVLSGAVLIARLSRGDKFNGKVTYADAFRTQGGRRVPAPDTARKTSGDDVEVWAAGMRNIYTITQTISGVWYGIDQGPGCPLGGPSVSCADYSLETTKTWSVLNNTEDKDWHSKVPGPDPTCPGIRREDKLIHLQPGKFYGHPNIRRGGGECAWIDPLNHMSADGKSQPPSNYVRPMAIFSASATAVREYQANHFCGAMRGDLVISTFRGVRTWRYPLKSNPSGGKYGHNAELLSLSGGLSFVEDHFGTLVFPRLNQMDVATLRPRISKTPVSLTIIGVWPRLVPRQGGVTLYVAGHQIDRKTFIKIDGVTCRMQKRAKNGREMMCTVPARSALKRNVVDVALVRNGQTSVLKQALAYATR